MSEPRLSVRELFRPKGMSGSLLPWWGWLLILQALLFYGLFEYVRRTQGGVGPAAPPQGTISQPDDESLERRLTLLEGNVGNRLELFIKLEERVAFVEKGLAPLIETTPALASLAKKANTLVAIAQNHEAEQFEQAKMAIERIVDTLLPEKPNGRTSPRPMDDSWAPANDHAALILKSIADVHEARGKSEG